MRVVRNGKVLAVLSEIRRQPDKLVAVWNGPPPPFEPSDQLEALVLESDDGLSSEDAWLCRYELTAGVAEVEFGSTDYCAPPWRRSSSPERTSEDASAAGGPGKVSPSAPEASEPRKERRSVLVVDDDADILEALADSLDAAGFGVHTAHGGREALMMTEEEAPDIAVIDLIMPEVSGQEVCRAIRADPRLAQTRILVLSAAEDARMVAAECDADGAITKPFTTALLLHEVRRLAAS